MKRMCHVYIYRTLFTLSVEFTLRVRLAVNGPNMLTSFCRVEKTQLPLYHFNSKSSKVNNENTCDALEKVRKAGRSRTSIL